MCLAVVHSSKTVARYAQVVADHDQLVDQCCAPNAEVSPAPRGGRDRRRCNYDSPLVPQTLDQIDVFENGRLRKTSHAVEKLRRKEYGLVAVGYLQHSGTQIGRFFDQSQHASRVVDTKTKGPAGDRWP